MVSMVWLCVSSRVWMVAKVLLWNCKRVCVQYVVATVLWVVVKVLGVVVKVLLCNIKGVLIVRLAVFWVVARAWI